MDKVQDQPAVPWPRADVEAELRETAADQDLTMPADIRWRDEANGWLDDNTAVLDVDNIKAVSEWASLLGCGVSEHGSNAGSVPHQVWLARVEDWDSSGWSILVRYAEPVTAEAVAE